MQGEIHGIALPVCTSVLEVAPVMSAVDMRISSLSTFSSLSVSGEVLAKTTQQCECLGDQRSCLTSFGRTSTSTTTHPMAVIASDAAVAEHAITNCHVHQMGRLDAFESPISSVPSVCTGKAPDGALAMLVVVGHRGCGKNKTVPEASMSSIRENTITSFNMAARNGAHFVEFDVQVTKDGVPVIFHDDVIITADSLPGRHICDVTLAEFRAMGPQRDSDKAGQALYRRAEDGSVNLWTVDVEDAMCTLAEAFNEVQPSVGFNIELKFDNDGMTSKQELHRVVDAVVKEVRQCANGRMIYFSSFHPDAVHMLRQTMMPVYPVFFLTDAGSYVYHDERRNSIEAAIEVCRRGDLQGIVSEVKAVLQQPACVALVKAEGLFFFTYGELNNVGEAVLKQQNWGIDGVIVDHVLEIARVARRPLHEPDSPSRNATSTRRSVSVEPPLCCKYDEMILHATQTKRDEKDWKYHARNIFHQLLRFLYNL